MKYRKKPVVIEAFKYGYEMPPAWFFLATKEGIVFNWDAGPCESPTFEYPKAYGHIKTLEGDLKINAGDIVIQGVQGELYPCKPDIFEATYELAD